MRYATGMLAIGLLTLVANGQGMRPDAAIDLDDKQLSEAIDGMKDPATRLPSYAKLMKFAQRYQAQMGSMINASMLGYLKQNPELKVRVDKAEQALRGMKIDAAMVKEAVESNDLFLRRWGIGAVDTLRTFNSGYDVNDPAVLALAPALRNFAVSDDPSLRRAAQNSLKSFSDQRAFLDDLVHTETEPDNIMFLLSRDGGAMGKNPALYSQRLNAELLRLLNSTDDKVRLRALQFIGGNRGSAPMYHCDFDKAIFHRVVELLDVKADREMAIQAFESIHAIDDKIAAPLLQVLSIDKDPQVRLVLAYIMSGLLKDTPNDSVARDILHVMVKDSNDKVKFAAIFGLGPSNYVTELEELTNSKDAEVAARAKTLLMDMKK